VGGSDKKKTKTTYQPPQWVEHASRQAIGMGRQIAQQEYQPFTDRRVAGLSDSEKEAERRAGHSRSLASPYFRKAADYTERGTQQFSDVDIGQYMNPYIKGALDPVAREIREEGARGQIELEGRAASMDAFGGSRAALAQAENREKTLQGISDRATNALETWKPQAVSRCLAKVSSAWPSRTSQL
jgi:hypothetical protein